jgi:hypothetical protein
MIRYIAASQKLAAPAKDQSVPGLPAPVISPALELVLEPTVEAPAKPKAARAGKAPKTKAMAPQLDI